MGFLLSLVTASSPSFALPVVPSEGFPEVYSSRLQKVAILGADDRRTEDEFGKEENIPAQKLSGLMTLGENLSGIVPLECYYTAVSGISYRYEFNGINICNSRNVLINLHALVKSQCEDVKHNFVCRTVPGKYKTVFFEKPNKNQFMTGMSDFCHMHDLKGLDIAVLRAMEPLGRTPLNIGRVPRLETVSRRQILAVERNVGKEFNGLNEKLGTLQFTMGQFVSPDGPNFVRANIDAEAGSSGSARLINQNGRPLVIGMHVGEYGHTNDDGTVRDGRRFSIHENYTTDIYFSDDIISFIKRNIPDTNKCIKKVIVNDEAGL